MKPEEDNKRGRKKTLNVTSQKPRKRRYFRKELTINLIKCCQEIK